LEWDYISQYGADYQGLGIYFDGPLDNYALQQTYCEPRIAASCYTPAEAWDNLWEVVPQSTFPYADEMHDN
jgi:hypothetical protein